MTLIERLSSRPNPKTNVKVPYSIFHCTYCNEYVEKVHNSGLNAKTCGGASCVKKYKEEVNRTKYPTTEMKMLKDVGLTEYTTKTGNTRVEHVVIVECPSCGTHKQITLAEAAVQKSCGKPACVAATRTSKAGNKGNNKSHGMSHTKIYHVWQAMKKRCDPKNSEEYKYKNYAGKGIAVCDEWQTFEGFYSDMGKGYEAFGSNLSTTEAPSIDRIDPSGNYELSNCQWLSLSENSSKDRKIPVVQFTIDNKTIAQFTDAYQAAEKAIGYDGKKVIAEKVNATCLGRRKTHAGCIWKKLENCTTEELASIADSDWMRYAEGKVIVRRSTVGKPVKQFSMEGDFIQVYPKGAAEAEDALGINKTGIRAVCIGKRKSAGGFSWKYVD